MLLLTKKIIRLAPRLLVAFLIGVFVVTSHLILSEFYLKNHLVYAAFNEQINYQGKLTDSNNVTVPDGTYHMMFRLYTSASSATTTNIWEEDRSTVLGNRVTITNGLFSVLLGSSTPLASVDFNQTLYLGIEIGGSAGSPSWDGEMGPRKKLGAVPAAFETKRLDGLSSAQFFRNDITNATSSATTSLSVNQYGAGKIAEFSGIDAAPAFSILSNGRTGVGTTSPWAQLSVNPNGLTGPAFAVGSSTATNLIVTNGGLVGIATTSPWTTLSVGGQVAASTFTAVSTTATSTFANSINLTKGCFAFNDSCIGLPGGATTNVQFNDGGSFGGGSDFTWDKFTRSLGITSNASGTAISITNDGTGISVGGNTKTGISVSGTLIPTDAGSIGIQIANNFTPVANGKTYYGVISSSRITTGSDITEFIGTYSAPNTRIILGNPTFTGTLTDMAAFDAEPLMQSGTITNYYGYRLRAPQATGATITNAYGLYLSDVDYATNNFAIRTGAGIVSFGGNVGVGTTSPFAALSIAGIGSFDDYARASYFIATSTSIASVFPYASTTMISSVTASTSAFYGAGATTCNSGSNVMSYNAATGQLGCRTFAGFSTSPGGANTNVQFNNAGNFGGSNSFVWNNTTNSLGIGTSSPYAALSVVGEVVSSYFTATSTTATSTINGALAIGNTGVYANATKNSFAVGQTDGGSTITSNGLGSIAFGNASLVTDVSNIISSGVGSLAGGNVSSRDAVKVISATGAGSVALGYVSGASAASSIISSGLGSFAMGYSTIAGTVTASGNGSIAWGAGLSSTADLAMSFGTGFTNSTANSFMVGYSAVPTLAVVGNKVGIGTTSPYAALSVVGEAVASYFTSTSTTATSTFANHISIGTDKEYRINGIGVLTRIAASNAFIGGNLTGNTRGTNALDIQSSRNAVTQVAGGTNTTAVGIQNTASASYNTAIGFGNVASGSLNNSAIGKNNTASGTYNNAAIGTGNTASGYNSTSSGYGNTASNDNATAIGALNSATAAGSTASGFYNISGAAKTTAIGSNNNASSLNSTAIGVYNFTGSAQGLASVAIGTLNNQTGGTLSRTTGAITGTPAALSAIGRLSVALGIFNRAGGDYANVIGSYNTVSSNIASSSAFGTYNTITAGGALVFGNGITNAIATSTMIGPTDAAKVFISGATATAGFVGVGTTTPGAKMNIIGALCVDDTSPTCGNAARTAGTIYSVAALSASLDLAEAYPTKDATLVPGEIVALDASDPFYVVRADKNNLSTAILGIVSTAPGFYLGGFNDDMFKEDVKLPIALAGRVPLKVSNENGPIEIGDHITLSDVPGVGMKALESGNTVGIALEPMYSNADTIEVFVKLENRIPESFLAVSATGNVGVGTKDAAYKLDVAGDARAQGFVAQAGRNTMQAINHLRTEDYQAYLNKIRNINISTFRYNTDVTTLTRFGLVGDEAPSEVLTVTGDVDVYKLVSFTLAGVKAQQLMIDSLESRIALLEGIVISGGGSGNSSIQSVVNYFELLGARFTQSVAYFKNVFVETMTVGTREKPTGITLYDEVTGEPYCLKISGGQQKAVPGECTDGAAPLPPTKDPVVIPPQPAVTPPVQTPPEEQPVTPPQTPEEPKASVEAPITPEPVAPVTPPVTQPEPASSPTPPPPEAPATPPPAPTPEP